LAAGPFAANTLAIFSGFCVPPDRRRVQFVSLLLIFGRALFFIGLITTGPMALLWMGLGMWLTMALVAPQQVDVWRGAYPRRLRARVLGYLRVVQTLATAVGAPLGGFLIDALGAGRMLSAGAALGVIGAAGYSRVRSQPVVASQRFTPAASLRILVEQPRYRALVVAWVVWGFGSFMATPLYALVLVDRFQASYADIGVLQLVGALSGLLAYFVLGQYLDRRGGFGATPIGLALMALVPLVYLLAPNVAWVALGYMLQNVGNSASDLGWQVALVSRVDDHDRLRYQAAHTSITGLRGVVAPFLGSFALTAGLGVGPVLVVGGGLAMVGAVLMASALGVRVPGSTVVRTVVGYAGRPGRNVGAGHRILGSKPRVEKTPVANVDEVLLPRQQRPTTQPIGGLRSAEGDFQAAHQLVHDPAWYAVSLGRVDVAEGDEVRQEYAPLARESTH
ncbi:MAG: MFS transporter, partial [Chloroflexi bacterium]|nr:MFS transporter [Chloroflexota bacterium]